MHLTSWKKPLDKVRKWLNVNYYSVWFIKENGCDKYYQYNRGLLFDEQQAEIMAEMDELERKF